MGKIIKKRIEYGGSSNSAENIKYDDTKNVKEAIDEIKASSSSNPTAASVTFNNTDTGLAATNVQDAITEVNGKLDGLIEINTSVANMTFIKTQKKVDVYTTGYVTLPINIPTGFLPVQNSFVSGLSNSKNAVNICIDTTTKTIHPYGSDIVNYITFNGTYLIEY